MNCLTTIRRIPRLQGKASGRAIVRPQGAASNWLVMTTDTELAAASEAEPRVPRRMPDLLGVAYLATRGSVMTVWVGGLIWAAVAVVQWLVF